MIDCRLTVKPGWVRTGSGDSRAHSKSVVTKVPGVVSCHPLAGFLFFSLTGLLSALPVSDSLHMLFPPPRLASFPS